MVAPVAFCNSKMLSPLNKNLKIFRETTFKTGKVLTKKVLDRANYSQIKFR
jgi:hypothetical protein